MVYLHGMLKKVVAVEGSELWISQSLGSNSCFVIFQQCELRKNIQPPRYLFSRKTEMMTFVNVKKKNNTANVPRLVHLGTW